MSTHKPLSPAVAVARVLAAFALAVSGGSAAQTRIDHSAQYDACMQLAARTPADALASARSWEEVGGGNAARHCAAIALFNQRDYGEAAQRLQALAIEIGAVDRPLTAGLFDQAGRAWLLVGEPALALSALGQAISLVPDDAELFIARSYAHAARENYALALEDLRQAEALAPGLSEIYLLKAAALRFQGDVPAALSEAHRAVATGPDNPDVFLERGNIRWLLEDQAGARADWSRVLALAPDSAAALAARQNLAR